MADSPIAPSSTGGWSSEAPPEDGVDMAANVQFFSDTDLVRDVVFFRL